MIYIDDYQEHELALVIKYTFIIVSRAPIPTGDNSKHEDRRLRFDSDTFHWLSKSVAEA